jgi:hypothetical protein
MSVENSASPIYHILYRIYYLVTVTCCLVAIAASHFTVLLDVTRKVLSIIAMPAIFFSGFLMDYIKLKEPSHILLHFLFFTMAVSNVLYIFGTSYWS